MTATNLQFDFPPLQTRKNVLSLSLDTGRLQPIRVFFYTHLEKRMGAKKGNTNARKHGLYPRHIDVGNMSGLRPAPPQPGRAAVRLILGMAKNLFDLPARLGSQLTVQPERTKGYSFRDKLKKVTLIPPTPFPRSSYLFLRRSEERISLFYLPKCGFHLGREGVGQTIRSANDD
jgi:hypothetical protein